MDVATLIALPPTTRAAMVAYYERVGPLLEASFAGVPLVTTFFAQWPNSTGTYEAGLHVIPSTLHAVPVRNSHDTVETYLSLSIQALLWQTHRGAIEFSSWTPLPSDPESAAFARILVRPTDPAKPETAKLAVLALRAQLSTKALAAALVADGHDGFALFIPLGDAPVYAPLRESLHAFIDTAAREHPGLIASEPPKSIPPGPAHVSVSTNACGRFSLLPYSVRGNASLTIAAPLRWDELGAYEHGTLTVHNFSDRLAAAGDVFASETTALRSQRSDALFG